MSINLPNFIRTNGLLIISLYMLLINLFLIIGLSVSNLIIWGETGRIVYIVFFYHVTGAWLSYFSFGVSLVSHVLYFKYRDLKWNRIGTISIIVGIFFIAFALITGSLFYNATSGGYNNIFWQWSDGRQTMTLVLFLSYLSYLIFRTMIEDKDKKAKLSSALGIALFPTVPLSYISAIIFTSLHPLINPSAGTESLVSYRDPIKLFILIFNLIAISILFVYLVQKLYNLDLNKEKLNEIIQRKLMEE